MNDPHTIKLSEYAVELIDRLTWGQQEDIRAAMLGGIRVSSLTDAQRQNLELDTTALIKAKYKAIEVCVKRITRDDGTSIPYTREWMDNLPVEDGDALFAAVNEVTSPKKKNQRGRAAASA